MIPQPNSGTPRSFHSGQAGTDYYSDWDANNTLFIEPEAFCESLFNTADANDDDSNQVGEYEEDGSCQEKNRMIPLDAKTYTIAGWIGITVMFRAVLVLATRAQWLGVLVSLAFLVSAAGFVVSRREVPSLFDLLFVLAALVDDVGAVLAGAFAAWVLKRAPREASGGYY